MLRYLTFNNNNNKQKKKKKKKTGSLRHFPKQKNNSVSERGINSIFVLGQPAQIQWAF